jgi:hypothetical protein
MTPIDEAPEQRWRRTVDRRNRPAKLKVDRLLRDFGYAELDPAAGAAIEARLAGVALAVAPSLREASANEVVTIYANDAAIADEPASPAAADDDAPADVPADAGDVAQMVTFLKQQVLDARSEVERLRSELDRRIAARADSEAEAQAIIAEQAAALQEQAGQITELGAALEHTRQALAETRDEIRRAVGELQALPEVEPGDDSMPADDEPPDEESLSGEESGDGREEAEAPWAVSDHGDGPAPDGEEDDPFAASATREPAEAPAPVVADEARSEPEEPVSEAGAPEERPFGLDAASPAVEPALDEPGLGAQLPAPDLDEPGLGRDEPAPGGELTEFDLDDPAPADELTEFDVDDPAPAEALAEFELDDRAPAEALTEFELDEPPLGGQPAAAAQPEAEDLAEWQPVAHPPEEPELDAPPPAAAADEALAEFDLPPAEPKPARAGADDVLADFDLAPAAPEPAAEEAPAGFAADADADEIDEDLLTGFDDFLYDADELYDPVASADALEPSQDEPYGALDPRSTALPPPPPVPPSPWAEAAEAYEADEGEFEPEAAPPVVERATIGKVLRKRGGRTRGRWQGSCSICGREPGENRRKDLEAAGWDLDDTAPACPQCRGIG